MVMKTMTNPTAPEDYARSPIAAASVATDPRQEEQQSLDGSDDDGNEHRSNKRARINENPSQSRPQPDAVVSALSGQDSATTNNITVFATAAARNNHVHAPVLAIPSAATDVKSTLRLLHNHRTINNNLLKGVIQFLNRVYKMNETNLRKHCKEIINLHGLSILVFCLEDAIHEDLTAAIMSTLREITGLVDPSVSILLDLDVVSVILKASNCYYPNNKAIATNVVRILGHLNMNEESTDAVIGDDCVDYCLKVMKKYSNDLTTQQSCVVYFNELSKIEGDGNKTKKMMLEKQVDKLLVDARCLFCTGSIQQQKRYKYYATITKESLRRLYGAKI